MAARAERTLHIGAALLAMMLYVTAVRAQKLLLPSAIVFDTAGNLYFADANRNQVFELSPQGALTAFAGSGTQGMSGDHGPATSANLNAPEGLAIGPDGTIYIADTGNQRIRAVIGNIITTVAGTGVSGFAGDNAAAMNAQLAHPTCVAINAQGALLICDTNNNRIRRIASGVITTIAGTGVQGFAGDGGAATAAALNAPHGVAIDSTGRILIADTLNQRVRVISTSGIITTLAGTGVAGYSGDNGPAAQAQLTLPVNVTIDAAGNVLIADTANERIRSISSAGIITTVAGNGVQGLAVDGTSAISAALNRPLAPSVSGAGSLVFTDSGNQRIRMIAADGTLFTLVPVAAAEASQTTLIVPTQAVYGSATAVVSVATNVLAATGTVSVLDGTSVVATSSLSKGSATIPLPSLSAGTHRLQATYAGDNFNAASISPPQTLSVVPAAIIVSAAPASMFYGQIPPLLTGTSTGILAQDAANVSVSFSTTATSLSPAGAYPIGATLVGSASVNYTLATSMTSGSLSIVPVATNIAVQCSSAPSYIGFPLLLTASLNSISGSVPVGQVMFYDAGTLVAQANVVNGAALVTYTPALVGTHTLTASFSGSQNFLSSSSSPLTVATSALPDFSIAAVSPSQSVQGGLIASYTVSVLSANGPFTGAVGFAISGLPTGATASFSPPLVVPGVSGATTTLSVQTIPLIALGQPHLPRPVTWAFGLVTSMFFFTRRKRTFRSAACMALTLCMALLASGCGARTVASTAYQTQASQLTVNATSTNLAGSVVTHTIELQLNVH